VVDKVKGYAHNFSSPEADLFLTESNVHIVVLGVDITPAVGLSMLHAFELFLNDAKRCTVGKASGPILLHFFNSRSIL
jgi:hypothetical protein